MVDFFLINNAKKSALSAAHIKDQLNLSRYRGSINQSVNQYLSLWRTLPGQLESKPKSLYTIRFASLKQFFSLIAP
jgi:hypothetical protein